METMKTPLEERLQARSLSKIMPNPNISLACFYEGASLLAGSGYLEWMNEQIQRAFRAKPTTFFLPMVEYAQNLITRADNDGLTFCGCELMHQLLIQPFVLVPDHKYQEETTHE